ncbi:helix-turn-helix transcriptional regulator [Hymenobacter pini]|uniref:helix-turn-helix transcriptional regulator n=1 Tax=Hymenobacter pini TaxID=2880879 RepID=UPI001CF37FB1|nr:AraC family transcriptional regulator [Hymenobacter pini]MCA8833322.1 AraC family transcriptional regulator [Hymenobacter pini]
MATTLLYVRHMVCSKCILVMRELLVELGLVPLRVELGEVELLGAAEALDWPRLQQRLEAEGFALLDRLSQQQRLVAQVKEVIAELLRDEPALLRSGHFSRLLSKRLQRRFAYVSDVFSATEGLSLEQYVVRERVEAARRLLRDDCLPVGRIANLLGYSNLGHLSRQFQRETGISPSEYRRQCVLQVAATGSSIQEASE